MAATAAGDVCQALTHLSTTLGVLAQTQPVVDANTLQTMQATQVAHTAALERIEATLARIESRVAVTYNAACGEGVVRAYVLVPNAAGALPAAPLPVVTTAQQFLSLSAAEVDALSAFYGVAGKDAEERRAALKRVLGLAFA
jgi:hypothetical protein